MLCESSFHAEAKKAENVEWRKNTSGHEMSVCNTE